jgi:hypothetical protein
MSRLVRVTQWTIKARPRPKPYSEPEPWGILGFRPAFVVVAVIAALIVGIVVSPTVRGAVGPRVIREALLSPSLAPSTVPPTAVPSGSRWQEPVERQTIAPTPSPAPTVETPLHPATASPSGGTRSRSGLTHSLFGSASWYCGKVCTRGYPSGYYAAAGHALRVGYWRGRTVTVCAGSCVRVILIDWCACRGRLIDLYSVPFSKLAPLSRGVIDVRVSW